MTAMVRLLLVKRTSDVIHRGEAAALAEGIAKVIKGHLEISANDKVDPVTGGLALVLLFDGKHRAYPG
jgi:hypothetical protein